MTYNKKKNVAVLIAAVFLLLALFNGWPYGYFTLLRFVVFAATAYVAWVAYEYKNEKWVWIYGFIAVLFNPIIPIYLNRNLWSIIDLVTGLFLIISVFFVKFARKP